MFTLEVKNLITNNDFIRTEIAMDTQNIATENRLMDSFKRCPFCYANIKLDATVCEQCKKKVGEVDDRGLAKKPFNYRAYSAAFLWISVLVIYIWLVFFEYNDDIKSFFSFDFLSNIKPRQ